MIFGGVSRHLLLKSLPALKLAVTAELKVVVAVTDPLWVISGHSPM